MPNRLLASWIGVNDLLAMAADLPAAKRKQVLAGLKKSEPAQGVGPIRSLLQAESFERILLISDHKAEWGKQFAEWLGVDGVTLAQVKITRPTDYESIFRAVDSELSKLKSKGLLKTHELCIHLSPGSPAMAATWVLLGKSRYPAKFYQAFRNETWETNVPFDLVVDFLPELYESADATLQHLAAASPSETKGFSAIIGESRAIRDAVGRASRAAPRGVPVLLLGESGVGKEMFARAIHEASPRAKKPFLAINCAAISKELLESELFGHAKGAFTGADSARDGAFKHADGGTLFLDEVGECSLDLQAKLLRVLQPPPGKPSCHREFRPVGARDDQTSNVRVVAATNRDLVKAVNEKEFREDLYYRLAVITVNLPPLRARKSDIPLLVAELMDQINRELEGEGEPGYEHKSLSGAATAFVKRSPWPGNVRQLYNALLQAAVLSESSTIGKHDIASAVADGSLIPGLRYDAMEQTLGDGFELDEHLNSIHKHYLERAMNEARGVKAEATRLLGLENYQTLDGRLKRLGVTGDWTS